MTSIKNKAWVQNFSFLCQTTAEKSSFNRFGCLGSTPTQTRPGGLTRPKSTPYIWNGHIPKIKPIAQCLLFVLKNNHPGAIADQVLFNLLHSKLKVAYLPLLSSKLVPKVLYWSHLILTRPFWIVKWNWIRTFFLSTAILITSFLCIAHSFIIRHFHVKIL